MKTRIYSILFFMLVLTGAFILHSCKQESPCKDSETTRNIPANDIVKLIYKGTEKLMLLDSNRGDTHTFYGQGYVTDYGYTYRQENCSQKVNLQRKYIIFQSGTYPDPIRIAILFYAIEGVSYLEVNFSHNAYNISANSIRHPFDLDSIIIVNKVYKDVDYFINDNNPQSSDKYGCYYNLTEGILKMETMDGHIWQLVGVEP